MSLGSVSPNSKLHGPEGDISLHDFRPEPKNNHRAALAEVGAFPGVVEDLVELINAPNRAILTSNGLKCVLDALCTLCATKGGAERCVAAGGVVVALDILSFDGCQQQASTTECEKSLLLLYLLTSSCDDGCAIALRLSATIIPMLGKMLLRVSEAATASAIAVLWTLCSHPDAASFRKTLAETAIPGKLVVVLQVDSKDSTKRRAGRLLRLIGDQ